MSDSKKMFRLWLIAVLVIAVARLLSGCARPATVVELEPWASCNGADYCQIGKVVCSSDNQPVIVVRAGLPEEQKPYTLIHEKTHVKQMQGHCRSTRDRFRTDSTFRVHMELEAYCTEAQARIRNGAPVQGVMGGLVALFEALYGVQEVTCPWLSNPP